VDFKVAPEGTASHLVPLLYSSPLAGMPADNIQEWQIDSNTRDFMLNALLAAILTINRGLGLKYPAVSLLN